MTNNEKEQLIREIIERILLKIPEIIGNLISDNVEKIKTNKWFYDKYPEFKNHRDIVMSVVEQLENSNTLNQKEILEKAVPLIKDQISTLQKLDIKDLKKPPIHGDL